MTPDPTLYRSPLITGGAGMLAQAFKAQLAARGTAAHVVPRAECDLTEPGAVDRLFDRLRPTVVLNCAAYTKVDLAEKEPAAADAVNGRAVGLLAAACRDRRVPLVHFSTDYVFDGDNDRPWRTTDPCRPRGAYGRSKLLGENVIRSNPPDRWMILRTAWLYGPGGPCFPATMVKAARAGRPLKVVADQHGTPTYTHDLAAATLDLLDRGAPGGVYHVTNAGATTWFDFTRAILDAFAIPADLSPTTSAAWALQKPDAAPRPAYSVLDVSGTEAALGRPMRPWPEALADYRRAIDGTL